jgi:hypothetical protein
MVELRFMGAALSDSFGPAGRRSRPASLPALISTVLACDLSFVNNYLLFFLKERNPRITRISLIKHVGEFLRNSQFRSQETAHRIKTGGWPTNDNLNDQADVGMHLIRATREIRGSLPSRRPST